MIKFTDFRDCVKDPPLENGTYLVVGFYKGEWYSAASLYYTVEYGWNTTVDESEHRIDYSDRKEGFTYFWGKAYMTDQLPDYIVKEERRQELLNRFRE